MKETFLTIGILLLHLSSNAQNYTISGYIKDNTNGENLIGANVIDQKSFKGSSSNTYDFTASPFPRPTVFACFILM